MRTACYLVQLLRPVAHCHSDERSEIELVFAEALYRPESVQALFEACVASIHRG